MFPKHGCSENPRKRVPLNSNARDMGSVGVDASEA